MKGHVLFLVVTSFIAHAAIAQRQSITRPDGQTLSVFAVDSIVNNLMDAADVAGLSLGIINDNQLVYAKGYGYKNKAKKEWNDTATCFYAASFAKSLFAYLVMQLVDEGKLDLDKPVHTYLRKPIPEYNFYKDLEGDERWKLITARHCLAHTTGFPNWREFNPRGNKKLEIFFTPGERYAYSGEGIYLLQLVVQSITGRQLEDLAQEKIFRPFGMSRTSFLWQPAFENNYALGHDVNGDTITKDRRTSASAAGSMETTIADFTRFLSAVMQGKGISAKSKDEMLSAQIGIYTKRQFPSLNNDTTSVNKLIQLSYGLGWGLFTSPYGKAFFKEGHLDGWMHYMISFPGSRSAFIIMTNSSNGESMFKELVERLAGVTIPWEWEGYFPYRPFVRLPVEVLEQYVGEYDGRLKAIVTLENGQLKVTSATVNLPKTNLYAVSEGHFFLKIMETDIRFVKGKDGKIDKAVLDDEGENYELKKVK